MSRARLWRDRGKVSKRPNCLLPFEEGFDHARPEEDEGAVGGVVGVSALNRYALDRRCANGAEKSCSHKACSVYWFA
jgi:hypothetical protein